MFHYLHFRSLIRRNALVFVTKYWISCHFSVLCLPFYCWTEHIPAVILYRNKYSQSCDSLITIVSLLLLAHEIVTRIWKRLCRLSQIFAGKTRPLKLRRNDRGVWRNRCSRGYSFILTARGLVEEVKSDKVRQWCPSTARRVFHFGRYYLPLAIHAAICIYMKSTLCHSAQWSCALESD